MRTLQAAGLTGRRARGVIRISALASRDTPAPERNGDVRESILALAQWHRRYGAGMIYLKRRQPGWQVNPKRVERLYTQAGLQVRRRKRKKIPQGDRLPLVRPLAANPVGSMDVVFDRVADGRALKCLAIVDDGTHESVAVTPEPALGGRHLTRLLDRLAWQRGLPKVMRTDNGKEFTSKALRTWARERGA